MSEKIACQICGAKVHSIKLHLERDGAHPGMSVLEYQSQFPGAPLLSDLAKQKIAEVSRARAEDAAPAGSSKQALHTLFGLGEVKSAMSSRGTPIMVDVLATEEDQDMIPAAMNGYVFNIEVLKNILLGFAMNIPTYVWGHAGTGKTTLLTQICAYTKRPVLRVQHTVNTEESHIAGQWTVKDGQTVFELGPLAMAMKHGWVYLADEYDFAMPQVLSVYQPVLEGAPLVIKEADHANRIIKPHPNFRFCATGNTNGTGDESGLYLGANLQNAANYDRFGVVEHMPYMEPKQEELILIGMAGVQRDDAEKLVQFATMVRDAFSGGKISSTISPRAMVNAAKLGIKKASWRGGLDLAFANKLSRIDREIVDALAQRVFC